MGEDNPVILYKPQGTESSEETAGLAVSDFVLALQTTTQRRFMAEFGNNRIVCLDSTHGTNQYDFNLVTVLVVDDFGEGNPVGFLVCNRENELALTLFFQAIKTHLPSGMEYSASHVMTDNAAQYYNAWVAVFGTSVKLLCTWHVDRAWRKAVKAHISSPDDQVEVYHMLRALLQELNEDDFWQCLNSFIQFLQPLSPSFAAYMQAYGERASEWAYCFRRGTLANTNMYVESFHNVLKSAYMERRSNRRIDSLLNILLKVARDKAYERLIKVAKRKNGKKVQDIAKRHVLVVNTLPQETAGGWMIPSQSVKDRTYFVAAATDTCSCLLNCCHCGCCPHMYQCSCVDFAVHSTVCKHVHTVHTLREDRSAVMPVSASAALDAQSMDIDEGEAASEVSDNKSCESVRRLLISLCQQITTDASTCQDKDALQGSVKHAKAAIATLRAVTRNTPKSMPVARKVPANKKMETQRRFHSTKIKRKSVTKTLHKPSADKVTCVKQTLMQTVHVGEPDGEDLDNDMQDAGAAQLFTSYDDVLYCVDSEDVTAFTVLY